MERCQLKCPYNRKSETHYQRWVYDRWDEECRTPSACVQIDQEFFEMSDCLEEAAAPGRMAGAAMRLLISKTLKIMNLANRGDASLRRPFVIQKSSGCESNW